MQDILIIWSDNLMSDVMNSTLSKQQAIMLSNVCTPFKNTASENISGAF